RAPLRFIDGAKVQPVFHPAKSLTKFDHYFCPLANKSSEKPLILSITPKRLKRLSQGQMILRNG
ncbi:MAG: hypothetical protein IJK99_01200, partial [Bacteroidales bacterium]|nr:hypothetical protein [Bacteroidales bacterium]